MKRIFLIIILMLAYGSLTAQHYTVSGIIMDSRTQEALPFANAALFTTKDTLFVRGASSDMDGHFSIRDVAPGNYLLRISVVGYRPWSNEMAVHGNMNLGNIALTPGAMLDEVSISATRPLFTMDGEKNIYNAGDDPSIQNGCTMDALQNAPGLEVDAEGNIKLRGVQAVSIWINGRESRMNAEALKQYLKTMPANNIKRIEVITNPSARYGGGGPMVNIVTQNNEMKNSFLSIGVNGDSRPEAVPWLSYIYNDSRWEIDLYADGGYAREAMTAKGHETLLTTGKDTSRDDTYSQTKEERSLNAFASMDASYHLDSLTTLSLWVAAYGQQTGWQSEASHHRTEYIYTPGDYSFAEKSAMERSGKPALGFFDGIWYERQFDDSTGHALWAGYFGSGWFSDSMYTVERRYTALPQNNINLDRRHSTKEWFHGIEAAYIRPFGSQNPENGLFSNELELGIEGEYTHSSIQITANTAENGSTYAPCPWMSCDAHHYFGAAGIYASYMHRWGGLSVKGGLRGELNAGRTEYADKPELNYSKVTPLAVPSIHITYITENEHIFSLSYTLRTASSMHKEYSGYKEYSLDGYTTGNALLKNSLAHRVEGKWDKYREGLGAIGIGLFYTEVDNLQGMLTDVVFEDQVFHRLVVFSKPINIGGSWNSGIDANLSYRPHGNVNIRFNSSLFYDQLMLRYRSEEPAYSHGMWCYTLRLNTWAKLWNTLQLFGNIYYSSPMQSLFTTTLARKGIDIGANADLLNRRLSLNLSINDLFDWNSWNTTSANPFLGMDSELKPTSRYLSFGVTLRLGQMELEHEPRKTKHPTAEQEER